MAKKLAGTKLRLAVFAGALFCFSAIVLGPFFYIVSNDKIIAIHSAISPNGAMVAEVLERSLARVDRKFVVALKDKSNGKRRIVFRSDDQPPQISFEKIVWSDDGRMFALLGDEYYVKNGSKLKNGYIVFLVYDLDNETLYCNSNGNLRYPSVPLDKLNGRFSGSELFQ